MSELYQSLSHSKWDCKYHVVFVPKRRRKVIFGQTRRQLGQIFHSLARQKECQILEGHLMPDHVHMCIAIPPKHPVASVIGFLKGKSAIAIARLCGKELSLAHPCLGVNLDRALILRTVPPSCSDLLSNPPTAATSFSPSDAFVTLVFVVSGQRAGDVAAVNYITPAGQVYAPASGPWNAVTADEATASHLCFSDQSLVIAGTPAANMLGQWHVGIYYNSQLLTTLAFSIGSDGTPTCTYTLNPPSATAASGAGQGTFQVSAGTGCGWKATSAAAWLTVANSSSSGSGSGTVSYQVAANTGTTSRTGTIAVSDQTFTLTQAGVSGGSEIQLYTNINGGACSLTGTSQFSLANGAKVTRFGVWYNWASGETTVGATVKQCATTVFAGNLSRSSCDPPRGVMPKRR